MVFNEFLKKNGQPEIKGTNSLTRMINRLKDYGAKIKTRNYQNDGERIHVYSGIKFRENAYLDFNLKMEQEILESNETGSSLDNFFIK